MWIRASLFTLIFISGAAAAQTPANGDDGAAVPPQTTDSANGPGNPAADADADAEAMMDETPGGPVDRIEATLAPCPDKPNCVSSQADKSSDHYVEPLEAGDSVLSSIRKVTETLDAMERVSWSQKGPNHIHAEFTSSLFGFVDDVDLMVEDDGTVHVRSASRTGYWDMGVNRKRVEALREQLVIVNSTH